MRQILQKKMTTALIAGGLVVGVGALAGVATAGNSDSPAPASRPSTDDTADNTVGTVPSSQVTTPTGGVTTPTLDDHGGDGIDDDDAFDDGPHHDGRDDDGEHEDSDDNSGPGNGDDDRSGSNSGPG